MLHSCKEVSCRNGKCVYIADALLYYRLMDELKKVANFGSAHIFEQQIRLAKHAHDQGCTQHALDLLDTALDFASDYVGEVFPADITEAKNLIENWNKALTPSSR